MKYIVEVNAKYLVSIEADSCLNAEHKLLDYNGIWGAMAYDRAMMKTDTFAGAVQGCEMISMNDLIAMVNEAMDAKQIADKAKTAEAEANKEVKRLEEMLAAAKKAACDARREDNDATHNLNKAIEKLGKQRI